MKVRFSCLLALCLVLFGSTALAAKAPAAEQLGSKKAAEHLMTHVYAYSCYWDGKNPVDCTDEGCAEYGHIHCFGKMVTVWDVPGKTRSRQVYYRGAEKGKIGPGFELQLIDVVEVDGTYYANVHILEDYEPIATGFVTADYIGCNCETYENTLPVEEYIR